MDISEEVQRTEVGDQWVTAHAQRPPNSEIGHVSRDSSQIDIKDKSAR